MIDKLTVPGSHYSFGGNLQEIRTIHKFFYMSDNELKAQKALGIIKWYTVNMKAFLNPLDDDDLGIWHTRYVEATSKSDAFKTATLSVRKFWIERGDITAQHSLEFSKQFEVLEGIIVR